MLLFNLTKEKNNLSKVQKNESEAKMREVVVETKLVWTGAVFQPAMISLRSTR